MVCVAWGHEDCLQEALKLKGIDLKTRNQKGETLIEVALKHKHLTHNFAPCQKLKT